MNLAFKDIAHQKLRFLATAAGLGLLFAIVLAMGGIYQGMIDDATILVDAAKGDLWLVQRDTRGPFAERSVVPMTLEERARVVPGVEWSRAFTTTTIQRTHHNRQLRATIVGVAWPDPPAVKLEAGRQLSVSHGELIADASLGLRLGEHLQLGDDDYRVVGTTRGILASSGDGVIYVTNSDCSRIQAYQPPEAIRMAREARSIQIDELPLAVGASLRRQVGEEDVASALLAAPMVQAVVVKVLPGHTAEEVRQRINAWSDVTVWSTEDQRQLLLKGVVDKARRQIGLFRGLLAVVSGILVALIIYSMTAAKTREISLLKLMGARTRVVIAMVLQQSMMLTGLGYVLALGVAAVAFPAFPRRVVVTSADLVIGAIGVVILAIVASAMAIFRALRIPPTTILSG
jgi:putative ABC transport system permease protein